MLAGARRRLGGVRGGRSVVVALRVGLPWLPAAIAAIYFVVFVAKFRGFVHSIYWDSDVSMITAAAESFSRVSVAVFVHCSWFTSFEFLLATRSLPFHRVLWDVTPYGVALAASALLVWASWRLAGRWAASLTAAICVAVSPVVNFTRIPFDFHQPAGLGAIVLAAFVLWVMRRPARRGAVFVAAGVAVLAGTALASDGLFAVDALVPFGVSGLALLCLRRRSAGTLVVGSCAAAVPVGLLTNWVARRLHLIATPAALQLAPLRELGSNLERLAGLVVQIGNGNYNSTGWTRPVWSATYALSVACAVIVVAAVAAPFLLLWRERRGRGACGELCIWALYWSTALVANRAAYAFTLQGTHYGSYLLGLLDVIAATVPLLLSGTQQRRGVVEAWVAALRLVSCVVLAARCSVPPRQQPSTTLRRLRGNAARSPLLGPNAPPVSAR